MPALLSRFNQPFMRIELWVASEHSNFHRFILSLGFVVVPAEHPPFAAVDQKAALQSPATDQHWKLHRLTVGEGHLTIPLERSQLHDRVYDIAFLHDTITAFYFPLAIDRRFAMVIGDTLPHRDRKLDIAASVTVERFNPCRVERRGGGAGINLCM